MAVDDDLIRKNPFEFQLASVIVNDSVTREAISRKQERAFLDFVQNDKHFSRYYNGTRALPMTDDVYACFARIIASRKKPKALSYLMGHSDIGVTLNIYTHIGYDDAKAELKRVVNGE